VALEKDGKNELERSCEELAYELPSEIRYRRKDRRKNINDRKTRKKK
jgi:hypothetical protein